MIGDCRIKLVVREVVILIETELGQDDYYDTNDPKVAALDVVRNDYVDEVASQLKIEIISVEHMDVEPSEADQGLIPIPDGYAEN